MHATSISPFLGALLLTAPSTATGATGTSSTTPPAEVSAPAPALPPASASVAPKSDKTDMSIPGWPLKIGASVFTRFEMREGYDRLGRSRGRFSEGELAVYRARLRLDTAPIDVGAGQRVLIRFAPQVDGFWGNQPGTVSNPNLGVNEAFLRLDNDLLTLDLGHFMMDYGDALVIGNLGWHQTARTFDGGRVRVSPGDAKYWVDVFFTQLSEGWGGPDLDPLAGDAFFTGIYADLGPLLSDKTVLEPYLLGQIWLSQDIDGVTNESAAQGTLGVRAKHRFGIVDVRLETGIQFGNRRAGTASTKAFAYHVDGEIGVTPMKGLRFGLEGLYASGDDPTTETVEAWDQLFPTAHKFLGLMDIIGARSNVASGVLHVKYAGLKPIVIKLDGHVFARPRTADGVSGYAGTELDLNVIYLIAKGLKLRVMYAVYIPGSNHFIVNGTAADEPAHYVETQFGYNF